MFRGSSKQLLAQQRLVKESNAVSPDPAYGFLGLLVGRRGVPRAVGCRGWDGFVCQPLQTPALLRLWQSAHPRWNITALEDIFGSKDRVINVLEREDETLAPRLVKSNWVPPAFVSGNKVNKKDVPGRNGAAVLRPRPRWRRKARCKVGTEYRNV